MKINGFGERLKSLLKQKKLTQAQVAAAIRTSVPSVNRWTKGGEIEYPNLRALADYLEVNWIWLRYGDEAIASLRDNMPDNNPMTDMRREYLDDIIASEARMKSALEMAEIVNWEWNVLTGTVTLSSNAEAVFGVEKQSLPNCMLPFVDLPVEELIKTFGQEQPHTWDFNVTGNDGTKKWFTSRAKISFDAANRPTRIIGVSAEITARKNAETALEKSENMMRKIVDLIPVGLWVADEKGTICLANPEVKRIWGGAKYVGLEQYGQYKGWWEKTGEEVGAEGWTLARAVKQGESSQPEVVNIEAFDGERRTITMYSTPLYNNENKIIGAIEVNQDITELKEIERSLKVSLEEWEVIFKQGLFGVLQISNGNISRVNDALLKLYRLEAISEIKLEHIFTETTTKAVNNKLSSEKPMPEIVEGHLNFEDKPVAIYLLPQRKTEGTLKHLVMFKLNNKM